MVLDEHEHFFCLHLFLSSHPSQMKWQVDWVGAMWTQCRGNLWLSSSAGSCWAERQLFSLHTLPSGCCSLRGEKRLFMDGDMQPPSMAKCLCIQQILFQVERKVSSSSFLEMLPVKGEKHQARSTWTSVICMTCSQIFCTTFLLPFFLSLSLLVIGVWHKQQPGSTSWAWKVQVFSTFPGK